MKKKWIGLLTGLALPLMLAVPVLAADDAQETRISEAAVYDAEASVAEAYEETAVYAETYGEAEAAGTYESESEQLQDGYTGFSYSSGTWYYLENGAVRTDMTSVIRGVVNGEDAWWYVKDGKVSFTTTVAPNAYGWWYVENGKVDFSHWGIEQNEYGWWRIENGCVNFGFTGFAENGAGWWYLENGAVNFNLTSVLYGTVGGENAWWYVQGGHVIFTTTVAPNAYGWWYIENGKVDFSHWGIEQNEYGWWRIENGCVNFGFNGFAENGAGWWYIQGGAVNFDLTSILPGTVNGEEGWWYFKNGHVIFDTLIASNDYGLWYVENGKVNFGANGTVTGSNGVVYNVSGGACSYMGIEVAKLVNQERAKYNLSALTLDVTLTYAALDRAAETSTLFSHTRPDGTTCFTILDEYGISNGYAAENIAEGQTSAEAVMESWMNSLGHRINILSSSYKKIGVGVYRASDGTIYWVQLFTD